MLIFQQSKKAVKAERDEELARLGIFKTVPKKTGAASASTSSDQQEIVEQVSNTEGKMLEDTIEEMRRNLGSNLTPVTPETFAIWYAKKKKEKADKRQKKLSKREKDIQLGRVAMTGRELFDRKRNVFVDDERADDTSYELDEDITAGLEEQMRMDAEVNGVEFDVEKFKLERDRILAKLKEDKKLGKKTTTVTAAKPTAAPSTTQTAKEPEAEVAPTGAAPIDESLFNEDDIPDDLEDE